MIIGIAGMSRSGKTTLAKQLQARLKSSTVLHLDDFVFPENELPTITRHGETRTDWEDPSGIDFRRLEKAVLHAKTVFQYVIVEGFMLFYDEKIRQSLDRKIILTISYPMFYKRRKPTYEPPEPDWYIDYVWEAYLKFHQAFEAGNDTLFFSENEEDKLQVALDFIL